MGDEFLSWAGALPAAVTYYLRSRSAVRAVEWDRSTIDDALAQLDRDLKEDRDTRRDDDE